MVLCLQPKSDLEIEIAAVLQQSQPVVAVAERPLSRREEMALKAMSLEEVCRFYSVEINCHITHTDSVGRRGHSLYQVWTLAIIRF